MAIEQFGNDVMVGAAGHQLTFVNAYFYYINLILPFTCGSRDGA
jgi:hypothetical protein